MNRQKTWLAGLILGTILLLGAGSAGAAPPQVTLHDLGTLTGGSSSEARAVNNSGVVAGGATDSSGSNVGMMDAPPYTTTSMQNLGTLDNYYTVARGINDAGQIVGSSTIVGSDGYKHVRAFTYDATNGMQELGVISGGNFSIAYGVNNPSSGTTSSVVGVSGTSSSFQAFYTNANGMEGLGSQLQSLNKFYSIGYGNNTSGDIVGAASVNNAYTALITGLFTIKSLNDLDAQAFLYSNGQATLLPTLGGNFSLARSINGEGQIVGYSTTADGQIHAFLYQDGTMTDLGTLTGASGNSLAYGINDQGQIVGASTTADGSTHAFIYHDGTMYDLGVLADGSSSSARAINDLGQVVGVSNIDGYDHAFITDPISPAPLPGTALLFGSGLLGALVLGRRKRIPKD